LKFGFVAAANLEFFKVCKYDAFLNYANPEWDFSLIHNSPALSPHGE